MGKIQINVLGTSFSAEAQEDEEYLRKLLSYYKEITSTIQNTTKLNDPMKVSILAGVTLVDELYKEKQKTARLEQSKYAIATKETEEAERITQSIIDKIDEVLD